MALRWLYLFGANNRLFNGKVNVLVAYVLKWNLFETWQHINVLSCIKPSVVSFLLLRPLGDLFGDSKINKAYVLIFS